MPKVLSNGIQLHYEEMGSGPETIVFFPQLFGPITLTLVLKCRR